MGKGSFVILAAVASAVLAAAAYTNLRLGRQAPALQREPLSSLPLALGGYRGEDATFPTEILGSLGVDEYLMRSYSDGRGTIHLYIGYYGNQQEGAVPHSPRHCYPGSGWTLVSRGQASIPLPGGGTIRPNRYVFSRGGDRECVIYWYQSRGRVVASEFAEKYYLVRDVILRGRSDGALVRLSSRTAAGGERDAFARMERWVGDLFPLLSRHVRD